MNILLVTAHENNASFTARLQNAALGVLERAGHKVAMTDLYAQQFNPVASIIDFNTSSGANADYIFEQERAVNTGSGFSPDINAEMEKVKNADLIIIHFPLWWSGLPAILKGWFDRVLAMGFAWDASSRYSTGLMRGKKVLTSVAVADPISYYDVKGMHGASIEQHLYGVLHSTLAFCGFDIFKPFIVDNTTMSTNEDLSSKINEYRTLLNSIEEYSDYIYKY